MVECYLSRRSTTPDFRANSKFVHGFQCTTGPTAFARNLAAASQRHSESHAQLREDPTRYDDLIASAQARDGNTEWPILPVIQLRRDNKCAFCAKSKCCTYITQAVPTPRSKLDFDHLLWQVSHENIEVFKDEDGWTRISIRNTAASGHFSTDRTMRDYNRDIWHLSPIDSAAL